MRFELSGSLVRPDPLVLMYSTNDDFDTLTLIDLGYTHFEIICIGGGGGPGGGIDTENTGTTIRSYGGAGGGGGYHRVRGLLSALPDICSVVVGAAGVAGTDHASNPASTTDGGDGGASTFNVTTCRASGGKGGKRVQSNSTTVTTDADGGEGGVGNRSIAGGGAPGGIAGTPSGTGPGTPGTNGTDGTIFNNIGKGGGGGAGGVGTYADVTCNAATSGGRGSWNPGDTAVYGSGDPPTNDIPSGAASIVPGAASGAKAAPLSGLPTVYGKSGNPGAVIVRLTSDVASAKVTTPTGPSTLFGRISTPFIFGKAVSGFATSFSSMETAVAEVSLASHGTPSERTNHSIKVRARITTGTGGVIKAALYEGATNRSGDLTSDNLTNSLVEYTLPISDVSAEAITSYSNLSIRFWGYDPAGDGLVFEVAEIYLELPTA